ncbi:MAG TPA: hypothetical protein VNE42_10300 [Acidimicrobiales bacterium]|nr:hypothetical protein [Acidimicrobiales bacterium]
MRSSDQDPGTLEQRLRLGPGFQDADRERVFSALTALDRHLARWNPEQVDIRLSVKHRESLEQRVTLEIWLPHWPSLFVHFNDPDLDRALVEARKLMIREIEDERERS